MAYTTKDYTHVLGMPGFSDRTLQNHLTLYQGYVNNTNKLLDVFARLEKEGKTDSPEYAECKRHFGWEFDGMRLHEFYFSNLKGKGDVDQAPELQRLLEQQWGGYEAWERDFKATGMTRGTGWAILYQDSMNGQLFNVWINEHDVGHLAGCMPILIMDAWEHAYMIDYDTKRAEHINKAFFPNIHWPEVEKRVNLELARQAQPA